MNELNTQDCSHRFTPYWVRFQGKGPEYLNYLKCRTCDLVLDAAWLVKFLGYTLTPENIKKVNEVLDE